MTSPPYWALRDYGTAPLIWDGNPTCEHQWEHTPTTMHNGRGDCQKGALYSGQEPIPDKRVMYASCVKCGAWKGSLGLEPTPEMFIKHLCDIFDEVNRVLKPEGTCWVNLGDCYGGRIGEPNDPKLSRGRSGEYAAAAQVKERLPAKSLVQIPARFQLEMGNRGWILRNEIIWHKPTAMPQSVKDRFTVDFERIFFFAKQQKYYFKQQKEPIAESSKKRAKYGMRLDAYATTAILNADDCKSRFYGSDTRNKRCVWPISTSKFREAHFATYPPELCETPLDAGCPVSGIVLDPFMGAGTTALVALEQGKNFVGVELNADYIKIATKRLAPYMPLIFVE